jgi:hypothetical protein
LISTSVIVIEQADQEDQEDIDILCVKNAAPMVGELFSLKSSLTNRRTTEDFPTAASPASSYGT